MARMNPKREKLIEAAVKAAEASGKTYLDPKILFGQASNDDMARYSAEMLALTAIHTADELGRWSGEARISVAPIEESYPGALLSRCCRSPTATCRFSTNR